MKKEEESLHQGKNEEIPPHPPTPECGTVPQKNSLTLHYFQWLEWGRPLINFIGARARKVLTFSNVAPARPVTYPGNPEHPFLDLAGPVLQGRKKA